MLSLVVAFALASALLQSLSDVIQHKAIFSGSGTDMSAGALGRLFKNKLWLLGLAIIVVGFLFQALALGIGQLVMVQTILVSMLVWVLIFAVLIEKVRLTRLEYLGSAPVVIGLVAFVLVVRPSSPGNVVDAVGWAIAGGATLVACIGLILLGQKLKPGPAAAVIGSAAGLINGLAAGLTAVSLIVLQKDGIPALATNWLLYATIAALLLGVLFPIWAFQAGPVTASMPPLSVFNPALAYVRGIVLLDENTHETTLDIVVICAAWILMIAGILVLSRSKVIAAEFADAEEVVR